MTRYRNEEQEHLAKEHFAQVDKACQDFIAALNIDAEQAIQVRIEGNRVVVINGPSHFDHRNTHDMAKEIGFFPGYPIANSAIVYPRNELADCGVQVEYP
jgi:hypothetical protein